MFIVCKDGNWAKDDIQTGKHYYAREGIPCLVSDAEGKYLLKHVACRFEEYKPPNKVKLKIVDTRKVKTFTDIIVPTYKNEDYTIACFKSIKRCTAAGTYRIIWVDNNSGKASRDKVSKCLEDICHTKILLDSNKGFVGATNAGLRASKAPTVCLLNNDTVVSPNWLAKLTSTLLSNDIGIIGAMSQWQNTKPETAIQQSLTRLWKEVDFPKDDYHKIDSYNKLLEEKLGGQFISIDTFVAFYCAVLRREVINAVGHLNEEFGIGCYDDVDYCEEATLKGFNLAVAIDTMIWHKSNATFELDSISKKIDFQKVLRENHQIYQKNKKRRQDDTRSLCLG